MPTSWPIASAAAATLFARALATAARWHGFCSSAQSRFGARSMKFDCDIRLPILQRFDVMDDFFPDREHVIVADHAWNNVTHIEMISSYFVCRVCATSRARRCTSTVSQQCWSHQLAVIPGCASDSHVPWGANSITLEVLCAASLERQIDVRKFERFGSLGW